MSIDLSLVFLDVLLAVNVASKWGATKVSYTQLPKLYDEYGARGLKVLAFPCNQFGAQEPGTNEEIMEFVKQYDADMSSKLVFFEKKDVNGADAREVYSFMKEKLPNEDGSLDIRWNFGTFCRQTAMSQNYPQHSTFWCFFCDIIREILDWSRGKSIQEIWN